MSPTDLIKFLHKKYPYMCEEVYAAQLLQTYLEELRRLRKNRHYWKSKADNYEKQLIELDKVIQDFYKKP